MAAEIAAKIGSVNGPQQVLLPNIDKALESSKYNSATESNFCSCRQNEGNKYSRSTRGEKPKAATS